MLSKQGYHNLVLLPAFGWFSICLYFSYLCCFVSSWCWKHLLQLSTLEMNLLKELQTLEGRYCLSLILSIHYICIPMTKRGQNTVSTALTESDNYSLWSKSMLISLFSKKNKVEFIDGTLTRDFVNSRLVRLWDLCNATILSWNVGNISKELITGITYSTDSHRVWKDLKRDLIKLMVLGSIHFTVKFVLYNKEPYRL